jgi:hypothetical protein
MKRPARLRETTMAKIKVIKSGKESAKPVNYCPWIIDSGDPAPQK